MTAATSSALLHDSPPAPVWTIVALVSIGLFVDQYFPVWGQDIVSIATWAMLLYWLSRSTPETRISMVICVLYATAGEIFLSLGWGLYEYRLHNIPLFVPPAHALIFVLGMAICPRMPNSIIWAVPLAAAPPVLVLAWVGADTMGLVLYTLLVLCMVFSNGRKLYAVMFMLTLGLEIYGTTLGNWMWLHEVPVVGWTTMNPPLAAGTFYSILDMLVVTTMVALRRRNKTALETGGARLGLHLIRFHGVLAPNAKLGVQMVPTGEDGAAQPTCASTEPDLARRGPARISWARLLKRVLATT